MPDWLRLALGTFTIVPVPPPRDLARRTVGTAMSVAPLLGVLIAVVPAAVAASVVARVGPSGSDLAAALFVLLLAVGSRGLHWDGLADCADAVGVRGGAERRLKVMREPGVGAFGVVAVVLVAATQIAALAVCVRTPSDAGLAVLAVALSRGAVPLGAMAAPAARREGLGAVVARSVPAHVGVPVVLASGAVGAVVTWWLSDSVSAGIAATLVMSVVAVLVFRAGVRSLGGVTGDVFGAAVELCLCAVLIALALVRG